MRITNTQPQKKWTVLYYLDGKNNLSPMAEHTFKSLDKIGSDDNVNLVAEIGLDDGYVQRGLIEKGKSVADFKPVGTMGMTDMGSADSVAEFLEWGMKKYPAEHYAVVLWDHGAGFKGILTDDEFGSVVSNEDLAQAMSQAQARTGKRIDVVHFNACLMNQAEVAYALKDSADYMVGSEETQAGFALPIPGIYGTTPQHKVAADLQEAKGNLSGKQLAELFVYEAGSQLGSSIFTPTHAAIDLSQAAPLRNTTENLAATVLSTIAADPAAVDRVRSVIKASQHYLVAEHVEPYSDYRDLGDFAKRLAKEFKDKPALVQAAQQVEQQLARAVIAENHAFSSMGSRMDGSTGLSVYLPTDFGYDEETISPLDGLPMGGTHNYEKTAFARNSNWLAMLDAISTPETSPAAGFHIPGKAKMLLNLGRFELPFVAASVAGGSLGALAIPTALIAGVDAMTRLGPSLSKLQAGVAAGEHGLAFEGLFKTGTALAQGAAAGALVMGSPETAALLSLGSLAADGLYEGVKLSGKLWNHVHPKSVEDKLEAVQGANFQPNLKAA
ncbi:MAG: clostripain-related cysteine peptidase [Vulcanimicrobiota bacterium]